ncbi:MAG: hypothetical protein H6999_07150 [Hahellaceae bacterium]|nr:hypothetical protein [Hahellaceae bacterium]
MNTPVFIDFEASSLDLVSSYPIEVGICCEDGSTRSWLVKPHVIWQDWSAQAQKIHGISQEELCRDGLPLSQVTEELNALLNNQTVYCDAWTFDSFWLHRLFKGARCKPTFHLESVSVLLNSQQIQRWQTTRTNVIKEMNIETHRAANDAKILHETWKRLRTLGTS